MKVSKMAATDGNSPLADRLSVLPTLGFENLRRKWRRLLRAEPPRLGRDIMVRAIAYRLQEIAEGGLSKVTQRRLMTLANQLEIDGRIAPLPGPRTKSGSRLIREWHGRIQTVTTIDEGFEFPGRTSAILILAIGRICEKSLVFWVEFRFTIWRGFSMI